MAQPNEPFEEASNGQENQTKQKTRIKLEQTAQLRKQEKRSKAGVGARGNEKDESTEFD